MTVGTASTIADTTGAKISGAWTSWHPGTDRQVNVSVVHELGSVPEDMVEHRREIIAPSRRPTIVDFKSEVRSTSARALTSPAYLAVVRRKQTAKLATAVESLASNAGRPDFAAFTLPISEGIRDLLMRVLVDADAEGNTREILRRVRDTFLNGGFNSYREESVQTAVAGVLRMLATAEGITANDVDSALNTLGDSVPTLVVNLFADAEDAEDDEKVLD